MDNALQQKLADLKGLILDADGVFFTGQETRNVHEDGKVAVTKTRSLIDGQGISFLRALGIKVVIASGENEPLGSIVKKLNELPSVTSGEWVPVDLFTGELKKGGKAASIEAWLEKHGLTWEECAYIGDDRTDWEAMQKAGIKIAPANAQPFIKEIADYVTENKGGDGAIREFADMVVKAKGADPRNLPAA